MDKLAIPKSDEPIVLTKWYNVCIWILGRVDSFPKNQRFIFGTRLADRSLAILELLVGAAYCQGEKKLVMLKNANREIAVLMWLIRMAKDRKIITVKQYGYICSLIVECGRMLGGWIRDTEKRI